MSPSPSGASGPGEARDTPEGGDARNPLSFLEQIKQYLESENLVGVTPWEAPTEVHANLEVPATYQTPMVRREGSRIWLRGVYKTTAELETDFQLFRLPSALYEAMSVTKQLELDMSVRTASGQAPSTALMEIPMAGATKGKCYVATGATHIANGGFIYLDGLSINLN